MNPRIHYTKSSITELEVRYATDAAANGWGDKCYEYINRFEEAFKTPFNCTSTGSRRVVAVLNLFTFPVRGEPVEPHTCFLQVPQ